MPRSASSATQSASATTDETLFAVSPKPWKPHAGQKLGVKFLLEHACAGLFADPGVGKTSMVYGAIKILKSKGLLRKVLVVAPLRPCYLVWPKEREKWLDFHGLRVVVLHGPKKDEALARDADVYVINYEGLDWLLGSKKTRGASGRVAVTVDLKRFRSLGFDTLVADELSKLKHHGSARHKALKAVLGTFARRWGLTGSPTSNGLMDLFGQCYILDMGRTFGPFITRFRNEYFVPAYDGFGYHLKKGAEQGIYDRIKPLALRLSADDYVDMPELINNYLTFDLPPRARRVYDSLEEDLVAKVGKNTVIASNAGVAAGKCWQVANGALYVDPSVADLLKGLKKPDKREWVELHTSKLDLLEELLAELQGSPLLVAYQFKHDLARLQDRLGQDVPYIGAGVSPGRTDMLERAWNRGELPVLLGHPQSVGHGLNLQGAGNHVCWFSMTYDYDLYDQFIRRVFRQGNNRKHVFVHHLIASETVDQLMRWALGHKGRSQTAFLDALRVKRRK